MLKVLGVEPEGNVYDEAYFESGIESGLSLYQNYRWIPELTIPMAMSIIDLLGIKRGQSVLDFGCAKGYLVKALRLLGRASFGVDISEYAIKSVDPDVKRFCLHKSGPSYNNRKLGFPRSFDFCIAKDVFEHLSTSELSDELYVVPSDRIFAVIPLGENGKYRAPANDLDVTHKICEPEHIWADFFMSQGWHIMDRRMRIPGVKDHYYDSFPQAHGFFTIERREKKFTQRSVGSLDGSE
jgi:SAM-dependent methyltransferase